MNISGTKKYGLYFLLAFLGMLAGYLILSDFIDDGIKNTGANPYAYSLEPFSKTEPGQKMYVETRRIRLNESGPVGISYFRGKLGIAYQHTAQLIDTAGREYFILKTTEPNSCIDFSPEGKIFLASGRKILQLDNGGKITESWTVGGQEPVITSFAFLSDVVYAACAGQRIIRRYDRKGMLLDSIDGKNRLEGEHGFILPSPYFDMAIDPEGELWVTHTGLLTLENYSADGNLRAYWGKPSFGLDGFTGCCNPVHFDILPDGSFVTCEKGLIRVKVHAPSGEFDGLVAGPDDFAEDAEPPDVAVDEQGRIFILDPSGSAVRIFKRKIT